MIQEHQQRVITEYAELHERTLKLGNFFGTKEFADLDKAEQDRLNRQWQIMQQLGLVLSEQISTFKSV